VGWVLAVESVTIIMMKVNVASLCFFSCYAGFYMVAESGFQTVTIFGLVNLRNLNSLALRRGNLVKAKRGNVITVV
jgi:hypothetical protein